MADNDFTFVDIFDEDYKERCRKRKIEDIKKRKERDRYISGLKNKISLLACATLIEFGLIISLIINLVR